MKLFGKQILLATAIALSGGAAQAKLGDLLRYGDGTVRTSINQGEASGLCREQGKRLPTARELAKEATKYGAEILELRQVPSGKPPKGFYLIEVIDPDSNGMVNIDGGKRDRFFYSYKNYVRPAGDIGNYDVWASSGHHYDTYFKVHWFVEDGIIFPQPQNLRHNAARCVSSNWFDIFNF